MYKRQDTIRAELSAYGHGLASKNSFLALTKTDVIDPAALKERAAQLQAHAGQPVHPISAVTGENMRPMLASLYEVAQAEREREQAAAKLANTPEEERGTDPAWSPLGS